MNQISGYVAYPGPGCVVEFLQDNKPAQAFVLEEQGGKLRLLLPNRRELSLPAARLLPWCGPRYAGERNRQEMIDILNEHHSRRERAAAGTDVDEIWSLAQGEVEKAPAAWLAELVLDSPDIDAVAGMGHALIACKSHFRFQPPDFEIYPAERVAARLAEQESQREREQLSTQGQAFFQALWDVHTRRKPSLNAKDMPEPELAARFEKLLRTLMADPDEHDAKAIWTMLAKGLPQPVRDDPFAPLHLATAWGLVKPHHNIWLDRAAYEPDADWANAHSAESAAVLDRLAALLADSTALPPLDLPFFSIDAPSTRDIDDAVCVLPDQANAPLPEGALRLAVCIACPALVWPFDSAPHKSALDKAVRHRATSIYLPEATHHMMPEELATDRLSLIAGQERPALVFWLTVSAEGRLLESDFSTARVKLAANLFYTDCDAALNGDTAENPISQDGRENPALPFAAQLSVLDKLADRLRAARIADGAVSIDREEPDIELIAESKPGEGESVTVAIHPPAHGEQSQRIVSELMILANTAVARWARERGAALFHRTQDLAVPKEFAGCWKDPVDIARALRVLGPALMETAPKPHAALGVAEYAPSTSPLRRYPDLVNSAQICHLLATGTPRWSKDELDAALPALNARLEAATQVQRFRPRYWKLLYFKQHGDKCWWDAVITEENDLFASVCLPAEQLILRVRRKNLTRANPGQTLQVRIGKVRPLYNEIQIIDVQED